MKKNIDNHSAWKEVECQNCGHKKSFYSGNGLDGTGCTERKKGTFYFCAGKYKYTGRDMPSPDWNSFTFL